MGFAPSQGKRVRWEGLEVTSLDDLRGRSQVFIFVPESLLLVKGSPARRRAHLDAFASALDPQYAAAARELQGVLRQRNAQLAAVKHGADPAALDPWDAQFARVAAELGRRRRDLVAELSEGYAETAAALAPAHERFELRLVAQLAGVGYDEAALLEELRCAPPGRGRAGPVALRPASRRPEVPGGRARARPRRRDRERRDAEAAGERRRARRRAASRRSWAARSAAPWSCRAAVATCASSGLRASSGPPSWRCCSRSSASRRRAPASRDHCSSTTS